MQTVSETFAGTITVNRQMRLALPRMAMSLLIMSYLVADGVLISRFVGTTALSALSMSYPLTALLIAAGFMIAAGGGAVAARALGAQKHEEALRAFSTALTTKVLLGLTLWAAGLVRTRLGFLTSWHRARADLICPRLSARAAPGDTAFPRSRDLGGLLHHCRPPQSRTCCFRGERHHQRGL